MKRTTNGYPRLSFAEFRKQADVIATSMTGNPNFPTMQPEVTVISAKVADYNVLDTKAATRDIAALLARNSARIELTNLLHQLGFGVSSIANGNIEKLASSGIPFSKQAQKSSPLQKPKTPVVSSGINSGMSTCKVIPQYAMKSVTYYLSTDPAAMTEGVGAAVAWESFPSGSSTFDFTNLIPGQRYYNKVAMVGVRDQVVMSEVVSFIAQ